MLSPHHYASTADHTTQSHARQLRQTTLRNIEAHSNTDPLAAQRGQMHRHHVLRSPGASPQVGITTNPGQQIPQHQILQVAQQYVQAQPALEHPSSPPITALPGAAPQARQLSEEEFRKLQHQQLDYHLDHIMRLTAATKDSARIERSRSDQGSTYLKQRVPAAGNSMMPTMAGSPEGFHHQESPQHRPTSSRSLGSEDRAPAPQEWMMHLQRPFTPPKQSSSDYSPITPAQTPCSQTTPCVVPSVRSTPAQRTSPHLEYQSTIRASRSRVIPEETQSQAGSLQPAIEFVDADPNATIKPNSRSRPPRSDLFPQSGAFTNGERIPTPPISSPTSVQQRFDATALTDESSTDELPKFTFPPPVNTNVLDFQPSSMFEDDSVGSKHHKRQQNSLSSFNPQTPSSSTLGGSMHSARNSIDFSAFGSPDTLLMSPGTMAMDDLTLDPNMTVEDTGVSAEEVQSYIHEDFSNNKTPFSCSYPDCGKRFGRRENIRSHIQTHLDDRQFRCLDCDKRFVRQHDLKRHTKIHTKEKPYKCACGNGFARQDALTRHRQRGICKGSFEGVVRTPVKRGRPRKHRPNDDDRQDKSARQRKRNAERGYASSVSGTSDGSGSQLSPAPTMDEEMDIDQGMSDEDIRLLSGASSDTFSLGPSTATFAYTPPMSPEHSQVGSPMKSPAAEQPHASPLLGNGFDANVRQSNLVPVHNGTVCMAEISQHASQQGSQAGSCAGSHFGSQPGSPPELSHSSPPSSARMVDFDSLNAISDDSNALMRSTNSSRLNDETIARLLAGPSDALNGNDQAWNDSPFFDFSKDQPLPGGNSFSEFCDEPLFSELERTYE